MEIHFLQYPIAYGEWMDVELYPGAILSHRSAFEFQPTEEGHIFLTYTYTKKGNLSGITLRFLEGHKPIKGDNAMHSQNKPKPN